MAKSKPKAAKAVIPKDSKWLEQIFAAQIVEKQGVVRRKKSTVHHYATFDGLKAIVEREQYHLIETGDQYIVICNDGQFKIHK